MAQSVKRPTLDFGSGHDLAVRGIEPCIRLCTLCSLLGSSSPTLSLSLPFPSSCTHILTLKINTKYVCVYMYVYTHTYTHTQRKSPGPLATRQTPLSVTGAASPTSPFPTTRFLNFSRICSRPVPSCPLNTCHVLITGTFHVPDPLPGAGFSSEWDRHHPSWDSSRGNETEGK